MRLVTIKIMLSRSVVFVLPYMRSRLLKAGESPYIRSKVARMARAVQSCSYCCPANSVNMGLAVAARPRANGNIVKVVYLVACFRGLLKCFVVLWLSLSPRHFHFF